MEAAFKEKMLVLEKQLGKVKNPDKTPLGTPFRKDLRISGQIGDVTQKDRLRYSSQAHQMALAAQKGYTDSEIIEAVVKAVNPGLSLRSYLEGYL